MAEFSFTPNPFTPSRYSALSLADQERNHNIHELFRREREYLDFLSPEEAKIYSTNKLIASGILARHTDGSVQLSPEYGGPDVE